MRNNKPQKNSAYSIRFRIAGALLALVLVQGLILLGSITLTGAVRQINAATYNILSNQSKSRKTELQDMLNAKRKNITGISMELSEKIERRMSDRTLASKSPMTEDVLALSLSEMIAFTKSNAVTGVFVVFDWSEDMLDETKSNRVSMYLRDSSPGIVSSNHTNLLLEYGYVNVARDRSIAVASMWTRDMDFSGDYNRDFYFKPVAAAQNAAPDVDNPQIYGYWNPQFKMKKDSTPVITYSLPLFFSDGTVYGVMGFEIDATYLSSLMKATEIPYDNGFYLLGTDVGGGLSNDAVIFSGAYANQFLSGPTAQLHLDLVYENDKSPVYEIVNANFPHVKTIGAYSEIGLYETFSPFYGEKWALLCMGPKPSVMAGPNGLRNSIIFSILSTILLASALSIFIMMFIARPVKLLSDKIKVMDPEKPVRFEKANIREIDELSGALEILSDRVSESAAKMSKIIELVDMPLGSFEVNHDSGAVHLSQSVFDLLGLERPADGSLVIPEQTWSDALASLRQKHRVTDEDGIIEFLYETDKSRGIKKWFRMRMVTENTRDIGVLTDVTAEIVQKRKLEYERSYDSLTKLLNREAFMIKANEMMKSKPNDVALMMFADLDDLKFVNDAYGHEVGDEYIRSFSKFLSIFKESGAVTGRISGDEFVMFMSGFSSQQQARTTFDSMICDLNNLAITVSGGLPHKLRVSIGLSYYPADSCDIEDLVKYADYAMYEIKHSIKGEVKEFSIGDYNKNSFVLKMKDMLNHLIDEQRVSFCFQPIVNLKTGEVFAYEALMRSLMHEFKSPAEILKVARSQSKLYQIEKLTFFMVLDWLNDNAEKTGGKKIFINSIPGQIFLENDRIAMCDGFRHLAGNVVFEITENEFSNTDDTKIKVDFLREFGASIAIDDYGSGYSNELALLSIEPDFLKIDMSIVRDIDKDADKQQLVQGTIAYASQRNIAIIAEGVETYEELSMLAKFGVNYVQGYYLAKPAFEIADIPARVRQELLALPLNEKSAK